jgi:hypothetical protein
MLCQVIGSETDSMQCPVSNDRGGHRAYGVVFYDWGGTRLNALSLVLDPEQLAAGGCCVLLEGSQGCSDR